MKLLSYWRLVYHQKFLQSHDSADVEELPTEVKISVNDNGVGIPIDKQKDLFKKFYQVDTTLTRERAGSGLGLAICKGIVKNHGGKIWVESTPNVGTTFIFTIPKTPT